MQRRLITRRIVVICKIAIWALFHESLVNNFINNVLHFFKFYGDVFNIPSDDCVFFFVNLFGIFWGFKVLGVWVGKDRLIESDIESFEVFKQFFSFRFFIIILLINFIIWIRPRNIRTC